MGIEEERRAGTGKVQVTDLREKRATASVEHGQQSQTGNFIGGQLPSGRAQKSEVSSCEADLQRISRRARVAHSTFWIGLSFLLGFCHVVGRVNGQNQEEPDVPPEPLEPAELLQTKPIYTGQISSNHLDRHH